MLEFLMGILFTLAAEFLAIIFIAIFYGGNKK
jgi:hypothetical protein